MDSEQIAIYLNRTPATVGYVGVTLRDGSPLVLPVWYRFDGMTIAIWTTSARKWPRAVARSGRASFAVGDANKPFAAVVLRGHAELAEAELRAEALAISARYIPDEDLDEYVASWWPMLQTIVRIEPDIIRGWDRGY